MILKLLLKRVGKPLEVVESTEKYMMDCAKRFFAQDVFTGRVWLDGYEFVMIGDDDGPYKELPFNFLIGFERSVAPVETVLGDVVFIRNKPADPWVEELWDFEVTDVTDQDIDLVSKLLDPSTQDVLREVAARLYGK